MTRPARRTGIWCLVMNCRNHRGVTCMSAATSSKVRADGRAADDAPGSRRGRAGVGGEAVSGIGRGLAQAST